MARNAARRLLPFAPSSLLVLTLAGVALLLPAASWAQSAPDSAWFAALRWRSVGPNRGGRSIAVAGSTKRPLEYYFGATGGGLWKSVDGGTSWTPVTDGKIRSSSVGAVAVAPSNPDVVYIGMGEAELRGNIMQGDGVYRSPDAGKTWQHIGLEATQAIAKIRVDPGNPDVAYVAALGHPFGKNVERGVFRTRDGGKTWEKVLYRNDGTGAVDVALDPSDSKTLYAALWEAGRTSWTMWSGGPGSGLFKSTDGGDHWTEITRNPGLPTGVDGKIGISVSQANPRLVWAMVENENGGLFVSRDAGATWSKVNDERKLRQRAFYYTHVFADPKDTATVYVENVQFFRSTDGGKTFKAMKEPHGDNHDLWIDPANPQRMINGNDGGGTVTVDGGETWTPEDYPTAQLYHVAVTKDFPYHICGAQQDNSTACVPSGEVGRYLARGQDGDYLYAIGGGESGYIAPDPRDPNVFFAGSQGALLSRYDRRVGQARDVQVYPRFFSGEPASALKERWQWTYPIVFSPVNPNVIYTSSQHLFRTINDGQSWVTVSPDLTLHDPKTLGMSGGPITHDMNGPEIYATIFTIAPSHFDGNTIWTGSDDGLAYLTRDGGATWSNVTPAGLPKYARISLIEASPTDAATAYLAAKMYQLDDRAPYLFRTHDYGKTWTKIVGGIPADDYTHAIREDPAKQGLLYAGTEHGIYVSFDDGDHWRSLSLNLPDTQVPDLVVAGNDLVIATHGRSMYVLDDIAPLRQATPQLAAEPVHLFQPAAATRRVDPATIQYWLRSPAQKVTIEILDGSGKPVRSFTGTPADTARKPASDDEDSGFRRRTPPPATKAGLNRFAWDGRYPGAVTFPGMILWGASAEQGPLAVPGKYSVRLTADGVVISQDFELKPDPRLPNLTPADYAAELELATKIRDQVSAANQGVIDIRALRKAIDERVAANASVASAATPLQAALTEIEGALYQTRNRSGQDPLNFPIQLNNRLAALQRVVDSGDGRPTAQSYTVFDELSAELSTVLGRLRAVEGRELASFNRVLQGKGLAPVTVPAAGATAAAR